MDARIHPHARTHTRTHAAQTGMANAIRAPPPHQRVGVAVRAGAGGELPSPSTCSAVVRPNAAVIEAKGLRSSR